MAERGDRSLRHRAILDLVRRSTLSSQEDLGRALARRGIDVTQSTLSRDLRALRIARVPGADGNRYMPAGETHARPEPVTAVDVHEVACNETVIVVRTPAGRAPGVAAWLDGLRVPGILGTLAGDDTILVTPSSTRRTRALRDEIARRLGLP